MLLILSSGRMMLSCFYAYASFVFALMSQKPFPLPEAAAVLFSATIITLFHHRYGWRRIYVVILHLSGLLCSSLWFCYCYYGISLSFWNPGHIPDFFVPERTITGWFTLILLLLFVIALWFCGIRLWTRPPKQTVISHRFDLGLALLLLLLLIKLIMKVKGFLIPMEPPLIGALLSFLIPGLFSMGLVRTKNASHEEGVTYIKGAGVVLSFMFISIMVGGGLFVLFLPRLQTLAHAGSALFGTLHESFGRILAALTMLSLRKGIIGDGPGDTSPGSFINRSGGEPGIFHYLFIGFGIAILVSMLGFIFYRLLKWVFSKLKRFILKTEAEIDQQGRWKRLQLVIDAARNLFLILWIKVLGNFDRSRTAEYVFRFLLRWGRFSGLKHKVSETPREYGRRLGNRFPQVENEIGIIVQMHDEALYGFTSPDSRQVSRARLALRRIRSPLLWATRVKAFCFHDPPRDARE